MTRITISSSTRWPVTLRAGALVLRPLGRGDEEAWNEVRQTNRAWLGLWDATRPPESEPGAVTFVSMVRNQRESARRSSSLPWALAWDVGWPDHQSRHTKLIGQVTVSGVVWGSARQAFIGYWIDHRWAGHGLVPLGVAMAADYCFKTLRLHRLEIDILPENERSHRVVEKLGFVLDGQRQSLLHINGVWREHDAYIMTADQAPVSLVDLILGGKPLPSGDTIV